MQQTYPHLLIVADFQYKECLIGLMLISNMKQIIGISITSVNVHLHCYQFAKKGNKKSAV
jgi:hypothetical protein